MGPGATAPLQAAVRGLLGSDAATARLHAAKTAYAMRRKALVGALGAAGIRARQ